MDSELLKQAIEDAKAVRLLCLSWRDKQFWGTMEWDDASKGTVKRKSCHCSYCEQSMSLASSASHAEVCRSPTKIKRLLKWDDKGRCYCVEIQEDGTEKFLNWEPPSFSSAIEERFPGKTYRL